MRVELGSLVPALKGWTLCVDACGDDCVICVDTGMEGVGEKTRIYLALYAAARHVLDYRLVAAMHIYKVRNRVRETPRMLSKVWERFRVRSRIPRAAETVSDHVWEKVLYQGILYAHQLLDLEKPVSVKVEPPSDKPAREKLRLLVEGKRVSVRGKTYQVGGLVKRLGGTRLAPWVYMLAKNRLPTLIEELRQEGFTTSPEILHGAVVLKVSKPPL